MGYQVAIDGPAGAGKSTIAKLLAKQKGFIYVDTGAMYRGIAVYFLDHHVSPEDLNAVKEACEKVEISIKYEDGQQQIYLCGENVTSRLRDEAVGNMASLSSGIPEVRKKLLNLQRDIAEKENVVMDGRDIGTSILPQANVKIFLTASVDTRARRRYNELVEKGQPCDYDQIRKDIAQRDQRDMTREVSPLRQSEDAVRIDSSDMTIEQVVETIKQMIR